MDLETLKNWPGKTSCFHRPLDIRILAWNTITSTVVMLVDNRKILLTPLQTDCLNLQMLDISEVCGGIQWFGSELHKVNIRVKDNTSLATVMDDIVRHSNGLAFVNEAVLGPTEGGEPPICLRVKNLVTVLQTDLQITTQRLISVLMIVIIFVFSCRNNNQSTSIYPLGMVVCHPAIQGVGIF